MTLRSPSRRAPGAAWIGVGVFAAALFLRLLFLRQLHASGLWDYLRLDPLYYHDWAVRIAGGEIVGERTYEMTPLYAYVLGAAFKLFGYSLLLPRLAQAALGAGTCALVALLGCRIFGRAEGLIAGMALAFYGPSLFHETQIMKTVLTVALSTATAAALYMSEGRRPRWLAASGALLGLTALAQENINVTLPFLLAWIAWRAPRGRRLVPGAALAAAFALMVAPATIRNYMVSGDLVLITSGGGEVFYTGNNEFASGHYRPPAFVRPDPFFEHEDFRVEAARRLGIPPERITRRESDAFWWSEGLRFIRAHPARYAALLWDKLSTYLNDYERPDNFSYENFRLFVPVLRLPLLHFGWILPFGVIGLVGAARRWPDLLPLLAIMGAYLLSALLFFTQSRYRMPMVPLLALFAAHGAVWLFRAAARRDLGRLLWSVPLLVGLFLFSNRDPGNNRAFDAQNNGIVGEMLLQAGRPDDAIEAFRRAIAMLEGYPGDSAGEQFLRVIASAHYGIVLASDMRAAGGGAPLEKTEIMSHLRAAGRAPAADLRHDALSRLGSMQAAEGEPAAAAQSYAGAVEADPRDFGLRLRLAESLHKAGRPREALETVERALEEVPEIDPVQRADAHYGEALIYLRDLPDRQRASFHLQQVLRLNPGHPRADWIRAQLEALGGRG